MQTLLERRHVFQIHAPHISSCESRSDCTSDRCYRSQPLLVSVPSAGAPFSSVCPEVPLLLQDPNQRPSSPKAFPGYSPFASEFTVPTWAQCMFGAQQAPCRVGGAVCTHMYVRAAVSLPPQSPSPDFPPPSGKGPLILGRRLQPSPSQIGLSSLLFPSHPLSSAPLPSPSPKAWGPPAVNTMPLTCVQVH